MITSAITITMTITLELPSGEVKVVGPLDDKLVCYGMLERTRDIVKDYSPAKSGLAVVQGGVVR